MHTKSVPDSDGDFAEWQPESDPCHRCGGRVEYRMWESHDGAYEDYQYRCTDCGFTWWVDGIDS